MKRLQTGDLLISDPFLKDPNFSRAVIILCEHQSSGSFGLILNKPNSFALHELMEHFEDTNWNTFNGGPVAQNSIHFLHTAPELIPEGMEVLPGVFWGGDFNAVIKSILEKMITPDRLKFFVGYSGWAANQLEQEMEEHTWLNVQATKALLFNTPPDEIWKKALVHMGGNYAQMANYPIDPQLN